MSSHFFTVFFAAGFGKQSALLDETVVGLLGLFAVLFKLSRVACVDAEMSAQQLCGAGRDSWPAVQTNFTLFHVSSPVGRHGDMPGSHSECAHICLSNVGLRFDG